MRYEWMIVLREVSLYDLFMEHWANYSTYKWLTLHSNIISHEHFLKNWEIQRIVKRIWLLDSVSVTLYYHIALPLYSKIKFGLR